MDDTIVRANLTRCVIVSDRRDNVGIAVKAIQPGRYVLTRTGRTLDLHIRRRVKVGFKVALCRIGTSQRVFRFGHPIGIAVTTIQPGDLVHVHNIRSRINTHAARIQAK